MSYKKPYEESEALKQLQAALSSQLQQQPGAYQSQWQQQLDAVLDKILNRPEFSYDLGSDALYRQYRDQYTRQGRLAMEDTLGKAQTMTGGYGNSYAQSAAQQTYQDYLRELNDRVPELQQLALTRYQDQGDALLERLGLLQDREDRDYSRYQALFSQWADQRDHLAGQYEAQRKEEYDRYLSDREFAYNQAVSDRDYALKQEQLQQDQRQWQAEFDEAKRQYDQAQQAKASGSSGGGSYAGNGGVDAATVRKAQAFVGADADGMWGPKSRAAAKQKGYSSLTEVIAAMGGSASGGQDHYAGVRDAIEWQKQQGVSQQNLDGYITRMTTAGYLTPAQAESLRRQYITP